jgi:hypothetical protein
MSKKFKIEVRKGKKEEGEKLEKWQEKMKKWDLTVYYGDQSVSLPYFTGEMIHSVDACSVLECLFNDASIIYNEKMDLTDFLVEFGYYGKAESVREGAKIYDAVIEEAKEFKKLLGDDFAYLMDCYMKDIDEFIEQMAKETEVIYIS